MAANRCMVVIWPRTSKRKHVICGRQLELGKCPEHGDGAGLPKAKDDRGSVNEAVRKLTQRES